MAALDAAFALAEDFDVAVLVGQDLELDVARRADVLLQVDVGRTEGAAGLVLRLQEQRGQLVGAVDDAHAASAAAGRSFQNHRVADLGGEFQPFLGRGEHAGRTGQNGDAEFAHEGAGAFLDAHHADDFGPGTDELDLRRFADFGEGGVLAEEAVAGVDGVDVGDLGGADDGRDVQVAARALGRSDADGLVGEAHVRTVAVGLGVDGDGLDSQFLAGADDANGDFAAIGDQDLLKPYGRQTEPPRTPPAARS